MRRLIVPCALLCLLVLGACRVSPRSGYRMQTPAEPIAASAPAPAPSSAVAWTTPPATYARMGPPPQALRCAPASCPSTAYLRPSDGWAYRESILCAPPASDAEVLTRACCLKKARTKSAWVMAAASVGVLLYGAAFWDYGTEDFGFTNEGWFGEDTAYGGADKIGHAVAAYVATSIVAGIHRNWGLSRKESAWRGALTAFAYTAMMEVGDGFSSEYGFSLQDLAVDAAGCLFGVAHETVPWVHRTLGLRWEYWPTERVLDGENLDITTDYEKSAYLLAVNVGALVSSRPTAWDLLDFQIGYQTRGYTLPDVENERWVFAGIGLNLANLLRRWRFPYAAFFDYYQAPWISLRLGYELNDGETGILYGP